MVEIDGMVEMVWYGVPKQHKSIEIEMSDGGHVTKIMLQSHRSKRFSAKTNK